MPDWKTDTARIINNILVGIAFIIGAALVLGALFGVPLYNALQNNEKVQHLTNVCIEKGYDGWIDGYLNDDRDAQVSRCYND